MPDNQKIIGILPSLIIGLGAVVATSYYLLFKNESPAPIPDPEVKFNEEVPLKAQNNLGSLTISTDESSFFRYPRSSKGVVLSRLYLTAGEKEDVEVSKIAMRISNLVPGQFQNVKLLQEGATQYGSTIENPPEIEGFEPNVIFKDKTVIKTSQTSVFILIADVDISSFEMSEFGTRLQREVSVPALTRKNDFRRLRDYSKWISAKGVISSQKVFVSGGADTPLLFY